MVRLILTRLIFVFALFLCQRADSIMLPILGGKSPFAPFCSSCTPGDPTDIMCDNLGGSSGAYTCTWDGETENANSYLTFAAIDDDLAAVCSGMGSYALLMHLDDSDGSSEDAYNTISVTASSTLYTQVYLNVLSTGIEDGEIVCLMQGRNAAHGARWYIRLVSISGVLRFQLAFKTSGNVFSYVTASTNPVNTDQAYRIGVTWIANTAAPNGAIMYVDGVSVAVADETTLDDSVAEILIGSIDGQTTIGTDDVTEIQYKLLGVDNDTMPSACS